MNLHRLLERGADPTAATKAGCWLDCAADWRDGLDGCGVVEQMDGRAAEGVNEQVVRA